MVSVLLSLLVGGVEVAPGAPCVDARAAQRLAAQVPTDVVVRLAQAKSGVLVVVVSSVGRTSLRREVPAGAAECEAVERVVLALVRSWLSTSVSPRTMRAADAGELAPGPSAPARGRDAGDSSVRVDAGLTPDGAEGSGSASDVGATSPARVRDAGDSSVRVDAGLTRRDGAEGSGSASDVGATSPARVRDAGDSSERVDTGPTSSLLPVRDAGDSSVRDAGPSSSLRGSASASDLDATSPARVRDAGDSSVRVDTGPTASPASDAGGSPVRFEAGPSSSLRGRASGSDLGVTSAARGDSVRSDAGVGSSPRETAGVDALASSSRSGAEDALAPDAGAPSERSTGDLRIGISVLGGVSSGTTADVLPQGLLAFDLVWRWLGVALDVGLSGGVKQAVAPGEVVASWQWLSLSGRAVWSPTERLLLDVQLGARGHRLVASATGFTMNEPAQTLFSFGGVGSVGASVRLLGPVGVTVRATGVVKPPERFVITNVQQTLDFGSLEGAVHAGLFARW